MTIQIQNWARGDNFGISIVSQYIQVRGIYIPLNFALVLNKNYITKIIDVLHSYLSKKEIIQLETKQKTVF